MLRRSVLRAGRGDLPLPHRMRDFASRLDVEWASLTPHVPILRQLTQTNVEAISTADDGSEVDGAEFRLAPMRPVLRIFPLASRNPLWGTVAFAVNTWSSVGLAGSALACHIVNGEPKKAFVQFFGFLYIGFVWSPLCYFVSYVNGLIGITKNFVMPNRHHFDSLRGCYTNKYLPPVKDLEVLRENIMHRGRLLYRLKRSTREGKRKSYVDELGQIGEAHYSTLGVPRTASQAEIKEAYTRLSNVYSMSRDPIRNQEIEVAYETLGDPNTRALYDKGGEAAVKTQGCNALFAGFAHPKCPTYRDSVRESIGGHLMRLWFVGDLYFAHYQMVALDRVDISRSDMEILNFIRWRGIALNLYSRILSKYTDETEEAFRIRCQEFVRKYVLMAPLGAEIGFMLGEMYIAVALSTLHPVKHKLAPKRLLWWSLAQYITIIRRFRRLNSINDPDEAGREYLTAQMELLQSDLFSTALGSSLGALGIPRTHAERLKTAKALLILGKALKGQGRRWHEDAVDTRKIAQEMHLAMKRWKKYKEKDINGIPF